MTFDTRGGFPTHWVEAGQGVRRVLFLHCSLAHSGAWRAVMQALDRKLKMRAFDLPGHGRSGAWVPGQGDVQDVAVAQALDLIDKRADLVGHSFGATVALRLARDHPDRVRSLTLIEPVLFAAAKHRPEFATHADEVAPFEAAMRAGDHTAAARAFDAIWGTGADWDTLPARQRAALVRMIPMIPEGAGVTNEDANGQVAPGALERIGQPVLLIEGSASPPIIHAVHDVLAARLPDVRRVVVAGAGHMVPITHPQAVVGEIAAFLKV